MEISPLTLTRLRELSLLTQEPGLDRAVLRLVETCLDVVPSCVALRVEAAGRAVLTSHGYVEARRHSRASLRLDLPTAAGAGQPGVTVLLLASQPGVFGAFAGGGDLVRTSSGRPVRPRVDEDLPAPPDAVPSSEPEPSTEPSTDRTDPDRCIQRAVGVLVGQGHDPDQARSRLRELARVNSRSELEQALVVLVGSD
jgi:hypothetical protein